MPESSVKSVPLRTQSGPKSMAFTEVADRLRWECPYIVPGTQIRDDRDRLIILTWEMVARRFADAVPLEDRRRFLDGCGFRGLQVGWGC